MHVALTFDPVEDVAAPFLNLARPKVASLRERVQTLGNEIEHAMARWVELESR